MIEPEQLTAVERAQHHIINGILDGTYSPRTELPGERVLSKEIGVGRAVLREALGRLSHDGWIDISQGRPTRVKDYKREGNFNILIDMLNNKTGQDVFLPDLMRMWSLLAMDYTEQATRHQPNRIIERLKLYGSLVDNPEACAQAMWQLHRELIDYCGNLVYGLIINSFEAFYLAYATIYYQNPRNRDSARIFWQDLCNAVRSLNGEQAAILMHDYLISHVTLLDKIASNSIETVYEQVPHEDESNPNA